MEEDEGTLEIRDGSEALWYTRKKHALIIYLFITLHISLLGMYSSVTDIPSRAASSACAYYTYLYIFYYNNKL